MKIKLFAFTMIALLAMVVVVSAATNFDVNVNKLEIVEGTTSKTFSITNKDTINSRTVTLSAPTILDESGTTISFSFNPSSPITIAAGATATVTTTVTADYEELLIDKVYSGNIVVAETGVDSELIAVTIQSTFCSDGEVNLAGEDLVISNVDIKNKDGNDDEWSPLDEISIEVEVSNDGNEKIKEIVIEIAIFDSNGKDVTNDLENLDDEKIDIGSISDGKDETDTFTFLVPADFEDDTYTLVIKAYSDDVGEDELCVSRADDLSDEYFENISGERETDEDKHIVVHNIRVSPAIAQCGDVVQVSAEVFNIGDEDYTDQVLVQLENRELGVALERVIREDFDQGDSATIDFEFRIPDDASAKSYLLGFRTLYEYDDKRDVYKLISDETFTNFDSPLRVEGCGATPGTPGTPSTGADVRITAQLHPNTPEAIAGSKVVVRATLTNTGTVATTHTLSIFGNSGWSTLTSIEPQVVTLQQGESRDILITLLVNEGASGTQEFTVRSAYENQIKDQRVALNIAASGAQVNTDALTEHFRENWFIYLIVIINVILIIAIIIVVSRIVAGPRAM